MKPSLHELISDLIWRRTDLTHGQIVELTEELIKMVREDQSK